MDEKIWKASQRTVFPFNFSLNSVIFISVATPLVAFLTTLTEPNWRTNFNLAITILISYFAFRLAEKLIMMFKDTLCNKGMFGKDLNKAGDRETKEKV